MFDDKLIRPDSLENVTENGACTGFRCAVRLGMDRGVWLSLVGGFYLSVDGSEPFPQEALRLQIGGFPMLPVTELKGHCWDRWPANQEAWLYVTLPGGLTPGAHILRFQEVILGGYFKAKEAWVTEPPVPGEAGPMHTYNCELVREVAIG